MTAKEKAKELLNKFSKSVNTITNTPLKKCALIAVDEILESNPTLINCNTSELNYAYWIEVKNQINQL